MWYRMVVFLPLSTLAADASPTNLRGTVASNKSIPSELAGGIAAAKGDGSNWLQKSFEDAPAAVMAAMLPPTWTRYGENYTRCTLKIQYGSDSFASVCLPDRFSDLAQNGHTGCLLANYDMFVRLHIGKLCSELSAEMVGSERPMAMVSAPNWIPYGKRYIWCTLSIQHGTASFLCLPDRFSYLTQNDRTECQLADYNMFVNLHIGMQCSEMPAELTGSDALTEDVKLHGAHASARNSALLSHHNMTSQVGWSTELSNVTSEPATRMGVPAP